MTKNDNPKEPNVEGRQGEKTHSAFLDELQGTASEDTSTASSRLGDASHPTNDGHHRLQEDREQHDEAEKNSEANRLRR